MKFDFLAWLAEHAKQKPNLEYYTTAREFKPDFPIENKPKFIPDKLLNSKQLTQR